MTIEDRARLATLGQGALLLLGLRGALLLLGYFMAESPLAEVVIGALIVDLVISRVGLSWGKLGDRLSRVALLTLFGVIPIAAATAIGVAAGWGTVTLGSPDWITGLSLGAAFATSVRDELLFRSLPFYFGRKAKIGGVALVVFATAISIPLAFAPWAALSAAVGLLFSIIYWRSGAWAAIVAHTAWLFLLRSGLHGSVLDLMPRVGDWSDGPSASGPWVWLLTALTLVSSAVLVWASRGWQRPSPTSPDDEDEPSDASA